MRLQVAATQSKTLRMEGCCSPDPENSLLLPPGRCVFAVREGTKRRPLTFVIKIASCQVKESVALRCLRIRAACRKNNKHTITDFEADRSIPAP